MFSVNLKLDNKRIILFFAVLIAATVTLIGVRLKALTASAPKAVKCSGVEDVTEYLGEFGLTVTDCVTDEICVPYEFGKVYSDYNEIQKAQGFDLSNYKGKSLTRYTFSVVGQQNVFVEVLTYKKQIVGADIYSVEADGFIKSLK